MFLLTGLSWGLGFLFIRVAVQGFPPFLFTFVRSGVAALCLLAIMLVFKRSWPKGIHAWKHIAVLGFFAVFCPFLFFALAGERIPSSLSAIYGAAAPLITALVTVFALRQETLGVKKIVAILVGAGGILVVFSPWTLGSGALDIAGHVYALIAVICIGFSFAYTRKFVTPLRLDPIGLASSQVLVSTVISAPLVLFTNVEDVTLTLPIVTSMLMLGAVSSGFAYVWNFQVIEHWGASSTSMVTYVTTIIGAVAGVIVLDETLTLNQLIGAIIVLASVAIGVTVRTPAIR